MRRGETEYAIGSLPLGGYVKITGMNPNEEIPDDVRPRAYYNQAVWKRVVTIAAGPAVNILIAFAIIWGLIAANGVDSNQVSTKVAAIDQGSASAGKLQAGDRVVSIDGIAVQRQREPDPQPGRHATAAPGAMVNGCVAKRPVTIVVDRAGTVHRFTVRPRYSAQFKRMLVGVEFGGGARSSGRGRCRRSLGQLPVGRHQADRRRRSRGCSSPRSASRSRAWSAPTRPRRSRSPPRPPPR